MRKQVSADVAILNSGTLRSDKMFKAGIITLGDLNDINPYRKTVTKVSITGAQLLVALEAGVSKYPALEGRFPQVSNIYFEFDPKKDPMSRINRNTIMVIGKPLEMDHIYTLAIPSYLADGKDGYDILLECTPLIDPDLERDLTELLTRFFGKNQN